jgi:hypothetical protein
MVYLTCTRHRSLQRKHIDVCKRCADNDGCEAFLEYSATMPAAPDPAAPADHCDHAPPLPIDDLVEALIEIRSIVAAPGEKPAPDRHAGSRPIPDSDQLFSMVTTELKTIRKLCQNN